ncbi:hypothetical protein LLH03_17750 [bacterium]|nr:hypothetical protein [bacterium]
MADPFERSQIDSLTVRVLRHGERARPDVRLLNLDGKLCVIKDYANQGPLFKRVLGAYLVWREKVAFERAAGIEGIPRVVGTIGPSALVTEYLESVEITSAPRELLTAEFFEQLSALVEALHARGIVHGDLKKLENTLVTPDGKPALVDFTAAFVTGSSPLTAVAFPWICDDDRRAVVKLKSRLAPQLVTPEEEAFLEERSAVEKAFRWSRRYVRYVVKRYSTPEQERASIRLK